MNDEKLIAKARGVDMRGIRLKLYETKNGYFKAKEELAGGRRDVFNSPKEAEEYFQPLVWEFIEEKKNGQ